MEATIHRFELAGLGKAPFRFEGVRKNVFTISGPGGYSKPGGSCDFCGTGIMFEFWCRSADGKKFKVGCDCIAKVGDAGLKRLIEPELAKMRAEANNARKGREAERVADALALMYGELRESLAALPHSRGFKDRKTGAPLTLFDEFEWMMRNAGHSGRLKTAKRIEAHLDALTGGA